MPAIEYVAVRNGGYNVAGTRIGLDAVMQSHRRGPSPQEILDAYSHIGSLPQQTSSQGAAHPILAVHRSAD
jgi:hypothetical protein